MTDAKQKALDTVSVRYNLTEPEANVVLNLVEQGQDEAEAAARVRADRVATIAVEDYDPVDARERLGSAADKLDKARDKDEAEAAEGTEAARLEAEREERELIDLEAEEAAREAREAAQGEGSPADSVAFANAPEQAAAGKRAR